MKTSILAIATGLFMLTACNKTANTTDTQNQVQEGSTTAPVEIKELSNEQFAELVGKPDKDGKRWIFASDKPIVVDFYATWCGPCKKMAPNMEHLAQEYDGKLTVYKVNVEKAPQAAAIFGINSIPALLFVNPANGQLSMQNGYQDYNDLKAYVKEVLGL